MSAAYNDVPVTNENPPITANVNAAKYVFRMPISETINFQRDNNGKKAPTPQGAKEQSLWRRILSFSFSCRRYL
jgi:hypothetical protein